LTETEGIIKIGDTAAGGAATEAWDGEKLTKPFKIRKQIGSTTYDVEVLFNPSSRETLDEKILRLVRGEAMKDGGGTS
jgi:hypothetical protein